MYTYVRINYLREGKNTIHIIHIARIKRGHYWWYFDRFRRSTHNFSNFLFRLIAHGVDRASRWRIINNRICRIHLSIWKKEGQGTINNSCSIAGCQSFAMYAKMRNLCSIVFERRSLVRTRFIIRPPELFVRLEKTCDTSHWTSTPSTTSQWEFTIVLLCSTIP